MMTTLDQALTAHFDLAKRNAEIAKAAEKLVKCKGRYHAEQNYKALAALFGIDVPTNDGWISVEDRMPEGADYDWFIVVSCGSVSLASCSPKGVFLYEPYGMGVDNVTHWMPLPEGPKK